MTRRTLVDLALRCYPAWWQERYAAEVRVITEDLIIDGTSPTAASASLFVGTVRARTRGTAMPMRQDLWATRTRISIAVATLPWVAMAPVLFRTMNQADQLQSEEGTVFPNS